MFVTVLLVRGGAVGIWVWVPGVGCLELGNGDCCEGRLGRRGGV